MPTPLELLRLHLPQTADNLEADPYFNGSELRSIRDLFEVHMTALSSKGGSPTPAELAAHVDSFCYDWKLKGPIDTEASSDFGTVRLRDVLAEDISKANPAASLSVEAAESLLDSILDDAKSAADRMSELRFYGDLALRPFQFWSTYQAASRRPFPPGVADSQLPCLLGLGRSDSPSDVIKGTYVVMEFPAPPEPRIPTFYDAASYPCWRPGGKTYPLPGCPGYTGVSEVVHNPISLDRLSAVPRRFDV